MKENKKEYDLKPIIANSEKVRAKQAQKSKQPSTSIKPLIFEENENDSPLKRTIISIINDRNLTYSDLYNYTTKIKGGDIAEGQKFGYNIISGLKKRPTMIDTTFYMLCDFLDLEIRLVPKPKKDTTGMADE